MTHLVKLKRYVILIVWRLGFMNKTKYSRLLVKLGVHGKRHMIREKRILDDLSSTMGIGC